MNTDTKILLDVCTVEDYDRQSILILFLQIYLLLLGLLSFTCVPDSAIILIQPTYLISLYIIHVKCICFKQNERSFRYRSDFNLQRSSNLRSCICLYHVDTATLLMIEFVCIPPTTTRN